MNDTVTNKENSISIAQLFDYLEKYLAHRLSKELAQEPLRVPKLDLLKNQSYLAKFINEKKLTDEEILLVLLALVPNVYPNALSGVVADFLPKGGDFPEFGGTKGKNHRGILPTGETALYLLAGNDIEKRLESLELVTTKSELFKAGILYLEAVPKGEPPMSGKLQMDVEYVAKLISGVVLKPHLGPNFPATPIETRLEWDDLILNQRTLEEIKELETWLKYNSVLMDEWNMKDKIKPGFRVMFYGPPGTGKTLTASLLGKYTGKDVYRIDLSVVVSKYIGETEKNLSSLFDKATNKNWILFFDEADAIFGKRTNVRDAHDKYANQEVSYLLQRIEAHPGLVILASNFKNNIDAAFTRRFQSIIEFELPSYKERLRLWQNNFPAKVPLQKSISLEDLAKKYALTGANIVNIVQYACLKTIAAKKKEIQQSYVLEGIKKELLKEGKTAAI
ncbi:ATP-binding protein [Kriegella aquimaris]|uniref:ATPase family associated with various cellular activities (AAA) n=1 Tax=Kriegella aquimaris TaxID=192904 RepID=A0A1G9N7Y0_9FLAO|nr:ATP-binding protein [Kriegella aquimaris]SDL82560.1 ATPase family associated with various cellular activities (AAA) [Kriegella aquimaris]